MGYFKIESNRAGIIEKIKLKGISQETITAGLLNAVLDYDEIYHSFNMIFSHIYSKNDIREMLKTLEEFYPGLDDDTSLLDILCEGEIDMTTMKNIFGKSKYVYGMYDKYSQDLITIRTSDEKLDQTGLDMLIDSLSEDYDISNIECRLLLHTEKDIESEKLLENN